MTVVIIALLPKDFVLHSNVGMVVGRGFKYKEPHL